MPVTQTHKVFLKSRHRFSVNSDSTETVALFSRAFPGLAGMGQKSFVQPINAAVVLDSVFLWFSLHLFLNFPEIHTVAAALTQAVGVVFVMLSLMVRKLIKRSA